jgi:ribose transport system substrate-binding protein
MKMGYLGVKQMAFHLRSQEIEKRIDTGVYIATKENMDDPEIKSLLSPDLSSYLD